MQPKTKGRGWLQCFSLCLPTGRPTQLTLLLVGINNAGKTTLLNSLKGDLHSDTVPTYGFSAADVSTTSCNFKLYDLGGGRSIRRIWGIYAPEVHGVIYVVDSADQASFPEAHSALQQLLAAPQLAGKPLLLFANKQDIAGAQPVEAVTAAMHLQELQVQHSMPCKAFACTARCTSQQQQADPALCLGLQWLQEAINPLYKQLQQKIAREAAAAKAKEQQRRQQRQEQARLNRLEREKQEQQQQQQQQEQQQGQQPVLQKQLHKQPSISEAKQSEGQQQEQHMKQEGQQARHQEQPEQQLIKANWPSAQRIAACGSQKVPSSSVAANEDMDTIQSAPAPGPAVPGAVEARVWPAVNTAAAPGPILVASQSSCSSSTTAASGASHLPCIPDQACSDVDTAAAAAAAAADESQQPNKPGMAMSLLSLLQAAVTLPGSAIAAPPAAPEFCDLRQAAHDLCGPTPRSHSISSDASSLLVSEASQQLRPAAAPLAGRLQHGYWEVGGAGAAGRRVSGTGAEAGSAASRRGSSAQGKAASQAPKKVARSTSLPAPGSSMSGNGGAAGRGMVMRRTTSKGRGNSVQGNRVQPVA